MSKADNRKRRLRREICSKLAINTSKKKSKSIAVTKEMFTEHRERT